MVFGSFTQNKEDKEDQPLSPLPPFNLPLKDESSTGGTLSLDLASTASTDTESSLSISDDQNQHHLQTVDLESPFGKLRHRTCDAHRALDGNDDDDDANGLVDDSDSEHGSIPRRRRQSKATSKRVFFYALAAVVAFSSVLSIRSTYVPSKVHNDEWRHFKMQTLPMVRKGLKKYQPEKEYTIILRGKRLDLLQQTIDNVARCSSVKEVHLSYEGGPDIPITLLSHDSHKVVQASKKLSTSAVFLLSEGILLSCGDLQKGFEAWKKDHRRLVGFLGYKGSSEDGKRLDNLQHVASGTGSYAFVSDRAMFIHRLYLDALFDEEWYGCCDVSLSAQVSAAFEKSPVVVKATVIDLLAEFTDGNGRARHQVGLCDDRCIPSWLQIDDWSTIPHQHTAILG